MPLPKDKFAFFASTRLMNTSSRLSQADALMHSVGNRFVKGLLGFDRSTFVEGELDDQRIRRSLDVEKSRVDQHSIPGVLGITGKRSSLGALSAAIIAA
jgi:hypothetical protein